MDLGRDNEGQRPDVYTNSDRDRDIDIGNSVSLREATLGEVDQLEDL